MSLPKLDLDALPNLDEAHGLFGSQSQLAAAAIDDRAVVIMVYIYESGYA